MFTFGFEQVCSVFNVLIWNDLLYFEVGLVRDC